MIARLGAQCDSSATTHNLISFQLMSLSLINNPTPSLPWTSSVSRSYSNPSLALVSLHSPLSFGLGFSLGVACEKNRGLTPVTVIQLFFFLVRMGMGDGAVISANFSCLLPGPSLSPLGTGREGEENWRKALYLQQRLPVPSLDDDDSIILFNLDSFLFSFFFCFLLRD